MTKTEGGALGALRSQAEPRNEEIYNSNGKFKPS